uniref:Uncharacterized protein n=1 Tax=Nelumbo nucifera TaxID=4432 RepID=A0A822YHA5_NELNU|nr:TPA_asm: hypothetical protein HUJ06_010364 [Nelumbo nucifera]
MLKTIIERRRASSSIHHDMLGGLLRGEDSRYKLSDEEIIDQLITILYSGYETVSTTSMMAVKFLHDHPRALEQLRVGLELLLLGFINSFYVLLSDFLIFIWFLFQEEHLEIRRSKGPEDPINWNDYKSMSFTRAVSNLVIHLFLLIKRKSKK